jgi:hypothetical protein
MYGAVSDVSRPLIFKLNQAGMQRSTYESLHKLLSWSLETLEGGIHTDLIIHEGHQGIVREELPKAVPTEYVHVPFVITLSETPVVTLTPVEPSNPIDEVVKSLTGGANASVADAVPLTADMLGEDAEDAALEAQVEAVVVAPVVTKVTKPK